MDKIETIRLYIYFLNLSHVTGTVKTVIKSQLAIFIQLASLESKKL